MNGEFHFECPWQGVGMLSAIQWSRVRADEHSGGLKRFHIGDAGYDLEASRQVGIPPGGMGRIPTNVRVAMPPHTWAMLVGRSSSFFKRQLLVQTAIIDNGFRGELWCVAKNMSDKWVTVLKGERVMQIIMMPLLTPIVLEVEKLPDGDRGEKGFGSTDE